MRYWPRRFRAALEEDPTRQMQIWGTLFALAAAYWLVRFHTPADQQTAAAVFFVFSDRDFAIILTVAGLVQLFAIGSPWWQARAAAAGVKCMIWLYAFGCFWLTNPNAWATGLLLVLGIGEGYICGRAIHDRDINGTEHRNDGIHGVRA